MSRYNNQDRLNAAPPRSETIAPRANHAASAPAVPSGMRFRFQDMDMANFAVMNPSLTASYSNDLLAQPMSEESSTLQIDYDESVWVFNESRLPGELGKELKLTPSNNTLRCEYGTQALDMAPEARKNLPVGKHDL